MVFFIFVSGINIISTPRRAASLIRGRRQPPAIVRSGVFAVSFTDYFAAAGGFSLQRIIYNGPPGFIFFNLGGPDCFFIGHHQVPY